MKKAQTKIFIGDCRDVLKSLPANSVHCCVTSPPYFGLRDYGTAQWEGGKKNCEHNPDKPDCGARKGRTLPKGRGGVFKEVCGKCGAIRKDKQIGLESTMQGYVVEMVNVFREVKRVLRDDGTLWLNLGDSYAGGGGMNGGTSKAFGGTRPDKVKRLEDIGFSHNNKSDLTSKQLMGIPWRVAFALQDDGWTLRQDIIWHKPNPMPESVTDRCTKAHEYMFLFSKNKNYYFDYKAIQEKGVGRETYFGSEKYSKGSGRNDSGSYNAVECLNRNKRSVWTVNTKPFNDAHFATFPPELIIPCIKAGCPKEGIVLDPFGGSGTTGMVANDLGRDAILIELNPKNVNDISKRRLDQKSGFFVSKPIIEEHSV